MQLGRNYNLFIRYLITFIASQAVAANDAGAQSQRPLAPSEAAARFQVPDGFEVRLFAGEPDIVQPISFTFDRRGRVWVVENLSYPEWVAPGEGHDRVVILEDSDNDGRFDQRKVFLEDGQNLTGIALGFGGVWLCSAPNLLFIPDRDEDDLPDGPAEVLLDGWTLKGQHNVVNGLTWGPDGWLYGGHGILATSHIGPPGTREKQRISIDCGIWRFHPIRRHVEVVAWGTTNPWGLDFDRYGQMFITNCVIKHLFYVLPGAHFQRMYGQDPNPHVYELLPSCADHIHWAGGFWDTSIGGEHNQAGGGHAHSGAMIYQGTNWPNAYRNRIFMHNLHGRRINQDILQPHGSGYIARHGADFAVTDAPWFRGVAIKSGPDGTVLLSDWNDTGECHDIVNTQKQTGRLYHVRFGTPELVPLDALYGTDRQLIDLLADANEWIARQARLALQERAAEGKLAPTTAAELRACFATSKSPDARLRYLWALHAMRQLDDTLLQRALADHHPWVRAWAIRFAAEDRPPPVKLTEALRARFVQLAQRETSAAVRLHLASVAGRLRTEQRWPIVEALATRFEDRRDQNIPWMIWYAIEPSIPDAKGRDLRLLVTCRLPATRRLVARKLAASGPRHLNRLIASWRQINNDSALRDLLDGTLAGLRGNPGISPPSSWASVAPRLLECANPLLRRRAEKLALLFGDATVRQRLIQIANDPTLPVATRRETIEALLPVADEKLSQAFLPLLQDGEVRDLVLRLLAAHPHPGASERIVHVYPSLSAEEKTLALSVLATRRDFANMMLDAIQSGRIPAQDMTPLIAAQLTQLRDTRLLKRLESAWGRVRPAPSEKQTVINRYRQLLTEDRLATADRTRGHQLFTRRCATCHRLFGEGKEIGPDLTGSQRQNIEYLLQNIVTPNAIVPSVFEAKTFFLRDGRVLTGIVAEKTTETVTVRTSTDYFNLPAASIEDSQTTGLSLMPEGLLADLDDQEIVDLVGYLTGPPAGRGAVTEQQQGERTR